MKLWNFETLKFWTPPRSALSFAEQQQCEAEDDEWQAEPLSHVEGHGALEGRLHLFQKFDGEAENADQKQYYTEKEARWFDRFGMLYG